MGISSCQQKSNPEQSAFDDISTNQIQSLNKLDEADLEAEQLQIQEKQRKFKEAIHAASQNLPGLINTSIFFGISKAAQLEQFSKHQYETTASVARLLSQLDNIEVIQNDTLKKIQKNLNFCNYITNNLHVLATSHADLFESIKVIELINLRIAIDNFEKANKLEFERNEFENISDRPELIELFTQSGIVATNFAKQIQQFTFCESEKNVQIPYSIVRTLKDHVGAKFWLQQFSSVSVKLKIFAECFLSSNKLPISDALVQQMSEIMDQKLDSSIDIYEFSVFVEINKDKFESTGLLKVKTIVQQEFSTFKLDQVEIPPFFKRSKAQLSSILKQNFDFLQETNPNLQQTFDEMVDQEYDTITFSDSTVYMGKLDDDQLNGYCILKRANNHIIFGEWNSGQPVEGEKLIMLPNGLVIVAKTNDKLEINDSQTKIYVPRIQKKDEDAPPYYFLYFEGSVTLNCIKKGSFQIYGEPTKSQYEGLTNFYVPLTTLRKGKRCYQSGYYEGNLINDEQWEVGTFKWKTGNEFTGEWKEDTLINGKMTVHDFTSNTYAIYEGAFLKGKLVEKGQITFSSGGVYIGEFKNGVQSGKGIFQYANENVYTGYWLNDKQNGNGIFQFQNGDRYEGQFQDGCFEGSGKYIYLNKKVYEGEWKADKWHKGIFKDQNGEIIQEGYFSQESSKTEFNDV